MQVHRLLASICTLVALASAAHAQDKACLLEGTFSFGGQKADIKDCLQNNGVPPAQFKETCNGLAQTTAAFGGPPAKITYLAACPTPARGVCDGFFGHPMSSHYYKHDAKQLADAKTGCVAQGGKWR